MFSRTSVLKLIILVEPKISNPALLNDDAVWNIDTPRVSKKLS